MLITIIIPLYNEAENLALLKERLKILCFDGLEKKVLFIDDHSTDKTTEILEDICSEIESFNFIRLSKNSGSHIAILAGMQYCKGDAVVFMAGDMQDPPELIPDMISKWRSGNDVVWAVRKNIEGVSGFSKFFSKGFYFLMNSFASVNFPPSGADFALIDRKVVSSVLQSAGSNPSLGGLIASVGFKQSEITYIKQARAFGKSKWTLNKKLQAFVDAFVAFSFAPMRIMIYTGMIFSFIGFIYAIFIIVLRLFFIKQIDGWASLMVIVLFIGGIQMLMIGTLGEYLWRNLEESRKKPLFFIEKKSNEET
jgi:glycosyltransferase involved in cell wall biosynthesis